MTRWLLLGLVVLGGCNAVFGVDETRLIDASNVDGEIVQVVIDGPGELMLDAPNVQASAPTDDPISVTLSLHGPANASVMVATTATGGTANPAQTTVLLNGNGLGQTTVVYTTPSSAGDVTVTFAASTGTLTAQQSATIAVHAVMSIGYDTSTTLGSGDAWGANKAIGVRIKTPGGAPFTVEQVGFWAFSVPASTHARWALYTDPNNVAVASTPKDLLASIGSSPVINGKNVYALASPVVLNPDTFYWLVGVFDQGLTIPYNGGTQVLSGFTDPFAFTTAFPATWTATFPTSAAADSYFLRGAQ